MLVQIWPIRNRETETVLINIVLLTHAVYVPIDADCASADLRVRVYLLRQFFFSNTESTIIIWYIDLSIIKLCCITLL